VAASARGLDTNWENAARARRELAVSVYPDAAGDANCRTVTATLTVFQPPSPRRGTPPGEPQTVPLDDQRLCRSGTEVWEPRVTG
jgi:hypothetical protein